MPAGKFDKRIIVKGSTFSLSQLGLEGSQKKIFLLGHQLGVETLCGTATAEQQSKHRRYTAICEDRMARYKLSQILQVLKLAQIL